MGSGTSMVAAHVACIVSLILEKNPYLPNEKVREILNKTAIPLDTVFEYGNDKVNLVDALNLDN
ncbi:Subtilisin (plasmid) [Bacillus cereus]|nr:S8 family serine peptidase [Bacillus cereus]ALZ64579.1 Subtilisin [Bacillus cereus]